MAKLSEFFALRGTLDKTTNLIVGIVGFVALLLLWQSMAWFNLIPQSLLPSPLGVLMSYGELHLEDELVRNSFYSIKLNLLGYFEAVAIAIPLGFLMGLLPVVRSASDAYVKAFRFVPLAATTGLFIAWFGIQDNMKIQFLAVSIIVYLIPVIIQRIDEVENVYVQTAYTLGANKLRMIFTVFFPAVMSRITDDIRILVAISWTYITIAEALNMSGGIGALIIRCARQSRIDKVFAVLLVIVAIGYVQDKAFKWLDRAVFPHKYV